MAPHSAACKSAAHKQRRPRHTRGRTLTLRSTLRLSVARVMAVATPPSAVLLHRLLWPGLCNGDNPLEVLAYSIQPLASARAQTRTRIRQCNDVYLATIKRSCGRARARRTVVHFRASIKHQILLNFLKSLKKSPTREQHVALFRIAEQAAELVVRVAKASLPVLFIACAFV